MCKRSSTLLLVSFVLLTLCFLAPFTWGGDDKRDVSAAEALLNAQATLQVSVEGPSYRMEGLRPGESFLWGLNPQPKGEESQSVQGLSIEWVKLALLELIAYHPGFHDSDFEHVVHAILSSEGHEFLSTSDAYPYRSHIATAILQSEAVTRLKKELDVAQTIQPNADFMPVVPSHLHELVTGESEITFAGDQRPFSTMFEYVQFRLKTVPIYKRAQLIAFDWNLNHYYFPLLVPSEVFQLLLNVRSQDRETVLQMLKPRILPLFHLEIYCSKLRELFEKMKWTEGLPKWLLKPVPLNKIPADYKPESLGRSPFVVQSKAKPSVELNSVPVRTTEPSHQRKSGPTSVGRWVIRSLLVAGIVVGDPFGAIADFPRYSPWSSKAEQDQQKELSADEKAKALMPEIRKQIDANANDDGANSIVLAEALKGASANKILYAAARLADLSSFSFSSYSQDFDRDVDRGWTNRQGLARLSLIRLPQFTDEEVTATLDGILFPDSKLKTFNFLIDRDRWGDVKELAEPTISKRSPNILTPAKRAAEILQAIAFEYQTQYLKGYGAADAKLSPDELRNYLLRVMTASGDFKPHVFLEDFATHEQAYKAQLHIWTFPEWAQIKIDSLWNLAVTEKLERFEKISGKSIVEKVKKQASQILAESWSAAQSEKFYRTDANILGELRYSKMLQLTALEQVDFKKLAVEVLRQRLVNRKWERFEWENIEEGYVSEFWTVNYQILNEKDFWLSDADHRVISKTTSEIYDLMIVDTSWAKTPEQKSELNQLVKLRKRVAGTVFDHYSFLKILKMIGSLAPSATSFQTPLGVSAVKQKWIEEIKAPQTPAPQEKSRAEPQKTGCTKLLKSGKKAA